LSGHFPNPPSDITVLAFDYGTRRVGVAVGNTLVRVAHELATIDGERSDARFHAIEALVSEWQPQRFVVGLPVHADGAEHEMTARARRFARRLEGRFGVPVSLVDERYTTDEAKARMAAAGRGSRRDRGARDAVAAQVILQAYFDEHDRTA
jgi:putative Holliday junction resolvase